PLTHRGDGYMLSRCARDSLPSGAPLDPAGPLEDYTEATMRKLLIAGFLAAGTMLMLSPQAISQGTGSATGADPAPSTSSGPGFAQGPREAPIGHRQPRAAEVPQEQQELSDPDKKMRELDEALTKKLNSICRGC